MKANGYLILLAVISPACCMDSPRKIPTEWLCAPGQEPLQAHDEESFWQAIDTRNENGLRALLKKNTTIKGIHRNNIEKSHIWDTPLLCAITENSSETIVRLLLNHGADVNEIGNDGLTPLAKSILFEQSSITELLIAHGALLRTKFKFNSVDMEVLKLATLMNQGKTVELIQKNLSSATQ